MKLYHSRIAIIPNTINVCRIIIMASMSVNFVNNVAVIPVDKVAKYIINTAARCESPKFTNLCEKCRLSALNIDIPNFLRIKITDSVSYSGMNKTNTGINIGSRVNSENLR